MDSLVERLDIKVIDTDTHIIEPYDLWTKRVPKKWGDLIPRVEWDEDLQQDVWTVLRGDGSYIPFAAGFAMAGYSKYPPDRPGTLAEVDPSTYDAQKRLKLMDSHGVYAQVLYPNIAGFGGGRFLALPDPQLRLDCVRAYNDWLTEWSQADPKRFIPIGALPFWDVDACVAEVRRIREMGHRGVIFSSHPDRYGQPFLADPHWDRLWAVAQELEMPINFHIGSGGIDDSFGNVYPGNGHRVNWVIASAELFMSNATAIADVICGGITHRFPDLKFVSVESGVGWVPFFLETLDWQWSSAGMHKLYEPGRLLPSEYFRRQFYASFWFEKKETVEAAIASLGDHNILYETDYPHSTCQAPGPASFGVSASDYIDRELSGLPEETLRKVLHGNAAKLYRLDD
jgi:uncharacterized protein